MALRFPDTLGYLPTPHLLPKFIFGSLRPSCRSFIHSFWSYKSSCHQYWWNKSRMTPNPAKRPLNISNFSPSRNQWKSMKRKTTFFSIGPQRSRHVLFIIRDSYTGSSSIQKPWLSLHSILVTDSCLNPLMTVLILGIMRPSCGS